MDTKLFVNNKLVDNKKLQSVIDNLTTAVMSAVSTESVANVTLPELMKPTDKIRVEASDGSWSKEMTGEILTAKVAQAKEYSLAVKKLDNLKAFNEKAITKGTLPTKGRQKEVISNEDLKGIFG